MGAFTITGVLSVTPGPEGAGKRVLVTATGPASYDSNGSVLNVASSNTTLTDIVNDAYLTVVNGVCQVGISPHASDKYDCKYIRDTAGAPATGTVKVRDLSAASDAEVSAATDLSGTTFYFELVGR